MTIAEVLEREAGNWDRLYLYPVGGFYKLYENSACIFSLRIKDFKASKRFVKTVNRDVVSIGFPISVSQKWLYGQTVAVSESGYAFCQVARGIDELEFEHWRDQIVLNAKDRFTPNTAVIEKSPVYKNAYDLLMQTIDFTVNVSAKVRSCLGERLLKLAYDVTYGIRRLYDVKDSSEVIDKAQADCEEMKFIIQILCDRKEISAGAFALASERTVSVSRQLTALRLKVTARDVAKE